MWVPPISLYIKRANFYWLNLYSNISQLSEGSRELSADIERKIDSITKTLSRPYFNKILKDLLKRNPINAKIIVDYIIAEQTEINIKDSTKEGKIKTLVWLSNYHNDNKSFTELTKQDILEYLNSLRKSSDKDPSNKWIGTYNGRQIILLKFFKWLYNSDEDHRKRPTPVCMQGIRKLPRKEKTSYKPSDIWEAREHAIFLKYCPSKRDRCYHALARDMSARPQEILNLRFKDIKFNLTNKGIQYAEVRITQGKTGPRTVPLIDSIPYLKEWMEEHPNGKNPDSFVFISQGNNYGSKLTLEGLSSHYDYYKKKYFKKLLDDNIIPDYDKAIIRNMLLKPWNLYVYRHSALTEKSLILPDSALKDHAGWSMGSKMTQVYVHLSNQSSKVLLQKNGIINSDQDDDLFNCLKPKQCSNCNESNRQDSKICMKCKMILSYDLYSEVRNEDKQKIDILEKDMKALKEGVNSLFILIQQNPLLVNIKPEVLENIKIIK